MTDREKIIRGLELCTKRFCDSDCPYYRRSPMIGGMCTTALQTDALALLKEQEPKQVIGIADSIEGMEVGYCPSCDRAIVNKKIDETKFCKFCGQAVKWK